MPQNEKLKRSTSTVSYKPPRNNVHTHEYLSLDGDGDVWVERRAKIKDGKHRSFFRSVRTNDCVWDEPPTGASFTVFLNELDMYPFLREFAVGPLGKPNSAIEKARKTPAMRKKGLFP